jgi:hypothetical protein
MPPQCHSDLASTDAKLASRRRLPAINKSMSKHFQARSKISASERKSSALKSKNNL